jgi:hypothetical protein
MNNLFRSVLKNNIRGLSNLTNFNSTFKLMLRNIPKKLSSSSNPFSNDDKSKSKFTKVSSGQNSNIPLEEENLANLLNEMTLQKSTDNQNLIVQKNEILFIAKPDEMMKKVKLGQFIKLNETCLAQCISIKDSLLTFLALNKQK